MSRKVDDASASNISARRIEARKIASVFFSQNGDTCRAEGLLERYFAMRSTCDKDVWREVIAILAQRPAERRRSLNAAKSQRTDPQSAYYILHS